MYFLLINTVLLLSIFHDGVVHQWTEPQPTLCVKSLQAFPKNSIYLVHMDIEDRIKKLERKVWWLEFFMGISIAFMLGYIFH